MAWKRGVTPTDPSGLNRWIMELSLHDVSIMHIPGKDNVIADALSRLCFISVTDTQEILRCTIIMLLVMGGSQQQKIVYQKKFSGIPSIEI